MANVDDKDGVYMGNSTFRNQLSFKVFNKSFENSYDSLYLYLNHVDRSYLKAASEENNYDYTLVTDPRNKQEVIHFVRDHSLNASTIQHPFNDLQRSKLTRAEHISGLRVLQALQQCENVPEQDYLVWQRTEQARCLEKESWQKMVYEYSQREREVMYKPMTQLVELYKALYHRQSAILLNKFSNDKYVTISGLPQVKECRGLNQKTADIDNLEFRQRKGQILRWRASDLPKCKELKHHLEYYSKKYTMDTHKAELQIPSDSLENHNFIFPLESLLFLLTAGDYIDLPTEMLLEIEQVGNCEYKRFKFDKPFPARNCGWHTNTQLVEEAYAAFIAMPGRAKWLQVTQDEVSSVLDEPTPEIDGRLGHHRPYKIKTFENFLSESAKNLKEENVLLPTNETTVCWNLKCFQYEQPEFVCHSRLKIPAALDADATKFLGCNNIKLEYKPRYGCEMPTKWELLRSWLQLKLLNAEFGMCTRISATDFELLLEERLTLANLENQLKTLYHIKMPELLGGLHEFLQMLANIEPGKYMLRYNIKYTNKLMLCAPSKEETQHAVNLHDLFSTTPTDFGFMAQPGYLPIVDNLCSVMHMQYNLLPCSFQPGTNRVRNKLPKVRNKLPKVTPEMERNLMLRKLNTQKEEKKKQYLKAKKSAKKNKKRARNRKQQETKNDGDQQENMAIMEDF